MSDSIWKTRLLFLSIWVALLIGCATHPPLPLLPTEEAVLVETDAAVITAATTAPTIAPTLEDVEEADVNNVPDIMGTVFGRTYHQADGNHRVDGHSNITEVEPLDIALDSPPAWIVSAPYRDGVLWVATLNDGRVQAFHVLGRDVAPVSIAPQQLPAGMPPLLVIENDVPRLLMPQGEISAETHAVPLRNSAELAYIDPAGNLVVERSNQIETLPVNALLDARIMVDEHNRLLLLSEPTTDYGHGVLGDSVEAASVTLVETTPELRIVQTIPIGAEWVIESIAPIWADMNGDGEREIIVTRANSRDGAQIVMFAEDGTLLAAGPPIGQGSRWRHQLAVGGFSAENALELVDVLTPHIGGRVEFYHWDADQLIIETGIRGYTSHPIGTRNLDMAVAGDWNSIGRLQLLIPTQDRATLAAIGVEAGEARVASTISAGDRVVTNLSATALANGQLAVGVGRADGVLRIWQPFE